MLEIKCLGCLGKCCKSPLTPILLPSEEDYYGPVSDPVRTPYRMMHLLKKNGDNCVFLDTKTQKCENYAQRPLECQIYPLLLDFTLHIPDVQVDRRLCPHLDTLKFNAAQVRAKIRKTKFPFNWVMGYKSLQNC